MREEEGERKGGEVRSDSRRRGIGEGCGRDGRGRGRGEWKG